MIQHRGAELGCRYDLSTQTSLLSLAYLLSVVHLHNLDYVSGSLLPALYTPVWNVILTVKLIYPVWLLISLC